MPPVARVLVESFVRILQGDREALERLYEMEFRPEGRTQWELALRPRTPAVLRIIDRVLLRGDGARISEMHVIEADGDRTVTTYHDVDLSRRFSADERERLFRARVGEP